MPSLTSDFDLGRSANWYPSIGATRAEMVAPSLAITANTLANSGS